MARCSSRVAQMPTVAVGETGCCSTLEWTDLSHRYAWKTSAMAWRTTSCFESSGMSHFVTSSLHSWCRVATSGRTPHNSSKKCDAEQRRQSRWKVVAKAAIQRAVSSNSIVPPCLGIGRRPGSVARHLRRTQGLISTAACITCGGAATSPRDGLLLDRTAATDTVPIGRSGSRWYQSEYYLWQVSYVNKVSMARVLDYTRWYQSEYYSRTRRRVTETLFTECGTVRRSRAACAM